MKICLRGFEPCYIIRNPEDRFSLAEAHMGLVERKPASGVCIQAIICLTLFIVLNFSKHIDTISM